MVPLPAHSILFKDRGTLGKEKTNLKVKRKHLLLETVSANLGTGYVTQQDLLEPLFPYFLYLSLSFFTVLEEC